MTDLGGRTHYIYVKYCCLWICIAFPLTVNCRRWGLFSSNCDGSFLNVTQRLVVGSSCFHWRNHYNRRTFKLEEVHFTFRMNGWEQKLRYFFCDFISWIQALKKENDFEEISGIKFSDWESKFCLSGICCQICQAVEDTCETDFFLINRVRFGSQDAIARTVLTIHSGSPPSWPVC